MPFDARVPARDEGTTFFSGPTVPSKAVCENSVRDVLAFALIRFKAGLKLDPLTGNVEDPICFGNPLRSPRCGFPAQRSGQNHRAVVPTQIRTGNRNKGIFVPDGVFGGYVHPHPFKTAKERGDRGVTGVAPHGDPDHAVERCLAGAID